MANNIGRLFELGQEFARTGKQKGSLNSALIDLKNSIFGVGGVLIGIQLLIGFLPQISRWFKKTAEEVNKTNEALNSLSANIYVAEQYVDILEQSNLEEGNRRGIIQELIKLVPDLKKEDLDYGENLDLVREKIEDYALAQAARIQIDNLVRENSELLTERARIDRIKNIQSEEERIAEMKKLLEEEGIETERILENTFTKGGKLILENREITDKEIVKLFDDFTSDTLEKSNVIKNQILDLSQGLFSALGDEDGTGREKVRKLFADLLDFAEIDSFFQLRVLFDEMFSFEDEIEKSGERTKEMLKDVGEESKKRQADITRAQKLELQAREIMEKRYFSTLKNLSEGLKELGAFDDAFKIASIITEKAEAIGKVVMATRKSNTIIRAAGYASAALGNPRAMAKAQTRILLNNIGSGIDIAAIVAQAAGSIQAIRSKTSVSKTSGGGSGSLGGGVEVEAPDFNVVGIGEVSQLGQVIGAQFGQPLRAYVVSSDVRTGQALERNITGNAKLG